jgi:hypothetical protein
MAGLTGQSSGAWWTSSGGAAPIPIPTPPPDSLLRWPRVGLSIAPLIVATAHNIPETVKKLVDAGANLTRINLLSALWPGVDCLPYLQEANGTWDLLRWNQRYFDRLAEVRERMNQAGIAIIWTNYELYSWSARKQGPQQVGTPWRHNVNGVYWKSDDSTFDVLPDAWSAAWFQKIVPTLALPHNAFEIGNEFPEKALHERVSDLVRPLQPLTHITINRNEDTPGQYANMKVGGVRYDRISFHGRRLKQVSDLDRIYPAEPTYRTFNQFFAHCPHDPKRVIFSSDGARTSDSPVDTYDWGPLREFFQEVRRRGCSIEHQSRAKMTAPPNHHMIEVDWFRSVIQ